MRVSLLSKAASTSFVPGGAPKKTCQQPTNVGPRLVILCVVSLTQSTSGVWPACWFDRAGIAYWSTVTARLDRVSAGLELSDEVLVSDQSRMLLLAPMPWHATPELHCASSAALELRKYSVPPFALSN